MTTSAAERLPRLLALVPYLRTHPDATRADVAAAFGISPDQVSDDLALLSCCRLGESPEQFIDIEYDDSEHIRLLDPQTLDQPLKLTRDEAIALLVAGRALADVPGLPERAALDRAVTALAAALGDEGVPPVAVALEPEGPALETVRAALDAGRVLHLDYLVELRDEVTHRDVDPVRLFSADGRWYLEAWCRSAEAMRTFRVDRIVAAEVRDQAGTAPEVLQRAAGPLFSPDADDLPVTFECGPSGRWIADYYPCDEVVDQPDGSSRITMRVADKRLALGLALRLGGSARLTHPAELAAEVRQAAERALAAYA